VQGRFSRDLFFALQKYRKQHPTGFPERAIELGSFFDQQIDESILARYAVLPADTVREVAVGGDLIITQRSVIDQQYDHRDVIGVAGYGTTSGPEAWDPSIKEATDTLKPVMAAYFAANPGAAATHPDVLLPFIKTEEERRAFERLRRAADPKLE
ncbi:MAG: hypothetical protein ACK4UN_16935, partial [Limisphaerales bacterium]